MPCAVALDTKVDIVRHLADQGYEFDAFSDEDSDVSRMNRVNTSDSARIEIQHGLPPAGGPTLDSVVDDPCRVQVTVRRPKS